MTKLPKHRRELLVTTLRIEMTREMNLFTLSRLVGVLCGIIIAILEAE